MLSSRLLSVFLIFAFAASTATALPTFIGNSTIEVIVIKDKLDDFLKNSGLIPLSRSRSNKETIRYTFGSRDNSSDMIVSQGAGLKSSSTPQNFQLHLDYPFNGKGALITYVEIDVEQSSRQGQAHILAGGTKERKIVIMVEANDTYWLKYSFRIYGIY